MQELWRPGFPIVTYSFYNLGYAIFSKESILLKATQQISEKTYKYIKTKGSCSLGFDYVIYTNYNKNQKKLYYIVVTKKADFTNSMGNLKDQLLKLKSEITIYNHKYGKKNK